MKKRSKSFKPILRETAAQPLELCTPESVRKAKTLNNELLKYHYDFYSELARQRNDAQAEIKAALISHSINDYGFNQFQRAVKFQYSLHPLSTVGSLRDIGGRFNTGRLTNTELPNFSALYVAKDKDTALQEHLGQIPNKKSKLNPRELALTHPQSETIVCVSGQLEQVFDLTKSSNLEAFIRITNKFKVSLELQNRAQQLKIQNPGVIQTANILLENLLHPQWRLSPIKYDIPANSQIFGHLVLQAGIQGILYPSKFTKKHCIAIFPKNFIDSDSYIAIDGEVPDLRIPTKIDKFNWRISEVPADQLNNFNSDFHH